LQDYIKAHKTKEEKKEKERARHRDINTDDIDFIPAIEQPVNIFYDDSPKRVGAYIRVSTDDENQTSSFEMQRKVYEDLVQRCPNWTLVEIYADEGISGTSRNKRDNFLRMIKDCEDKKIDLVVVKNVSRFARNLLICLEYTRKLADLNPPVGVLFELEHIYTLNEHSEAALVASAQFAEKESEWKSILIKDAYTKRSKYGIVWVPELLGYDLDDDGNLVINEEEAQTVRLIFFMYLYGYSTVEIAEKLTGLGLRTNRPLKDRDGKIIGWNRTWAAGSVLQILQNERHCGEVLTQKTWTPNFRTHKSIKNRGTLPQWRKRNHHEPIITRDDFIAVQRLIQNAKYGNKGLLPELKVITDGALLGFVSLNLRWAAFHAEDYRSASLSAYGDDGQPTERQTEVAVQLGDFDLRGYEVVRSQFFNTSDKKCITFSNTHLWFGIECLRKFQSTLYVEILINSTEHLLAVRPCAKDNRNAIRWSKIMGDQYLPRPIPGTAFLKTLYELFRWDTDCRYRVRGIRRQKGDEAVLIFDMHETEVFIPAGVIGEDAAAAGKTVKAFPQTMAVGFGTEHYEIIRPRETAAIDSDGRWGITADGQPFKDESSLNVTAPDSLADNIKNIVNGIAQRESDGN
jgi:DNA invertase Pin-like site-specific DNA recombinase